MIDRDDVMAVSAKIVVMAKTINPVTTKTINVVMTTATTMKAVTTSDKLNSLMYDKKPTKISYYFIFVFIIFLFHISYNIHVQ